MRKLLVVLAALCGGASPALAGEPGFELHGDLGPAYVRSAGNKNGFSQSVGGLGAAHSLMLGWATSSGLVVGAEYWGTFVYSPRVQAVGPGGGRGLTYKAYGFGPCARYQLPSGIFGAVTPSVTRLSLSDNDDHGFAWRWGFGLRVAAGQEWRLNDRWTLGVAGTVQLALNEQTERATPRWNTVGGGVVMAFGFR